MGRQYHRVVRSKSANSEPLSIRPYQLAEDAEAGLGGIRHPRLLSRWLMSNDDDDDDDDDSI